ncbi:odorant receptor 131-2-like [Symphorus nematophorus]
MLRAQSSSSMQSTGRPASRLRVGESSVRTENIQFELGASLGWLSHCFGNKPTSLPEDRDPRSDGETHSDNSRKVMADNNSLVAGEVSLRQVNVIIVQVLVMIFLCINFLLIITFFQKECFYKTARYLLFAVTLLSDSLILIMSDILLILFYFQCAMKVWLCIIICVGILPHMTVTPVTLTAMTLERYVAICMPLRHAELCSTRSTMHCILIIHGLSSVPCIVILSTFFVSASSSLYKQYKLCSVEMFILYRWQAHLRSAISQFYFLIVCIIIVFSYVKIMKVAKAASGENKKSMWKGLRTVILHAFQLLLCLIQLWCPFIENAILQINVMLFINVRSINYILFSLAPRCLSPLIYGLRDEKFFQALKSSATFGLYKRST